MGSTICQAMGVVALVLYATAPTLLLLGLVGVRASVAITSVGSGLVALACLAQGMPAAALSCVAVALCAQPIALLASPCGAERDVDVVLAGAVQAFVTTSMVASVPFCGTGVCRGTAVGSFALLSLCALADIVSGRVRAVAHLLDGFCVLVAAVVAVAAAATLAPRGEGLGLAIARGRMADVALCLCLPAAAAASQHWDDDGPTTVGLLPAALALASLSVGLARLGDLASGVSVVLASGVASASGRRRVRGSLVAVLVGVLAAVVAYAAFAPAGGHLVGWHGPVEGMPLAVGQGVPWSTDVAAARGFGICANAYMAATAACGAAWPLACAYGTFGLPAVVSLALVALCAVVAGVRQAMLGGRCSHASFLCVAFGTVALVALASALGLCPRVQEHAGMAFLCVDGVTSLPSPLVVAIAVSLACDHAPGSSEADARAS